MVLGLGAKVPRCHNEDFGSLESEVAPGGIRVGRHVPDPEPRGRDS